MSPHFKMYDGFYGDPLLMMRVLWGALLVTLVVTLALSAVFLVFRGLGMQRMAKRKNIPNGWMGYVPVLNLYLLGQLSNMPDKRRRSDIAMLVLSILSCLSAIVCVAYIFPFFSMSMNLFNNPRLGDRDVIDMLSMIWGLFAASIIASGFSVARDVLKFIALNRVYKQFSPDNSTIMTVFTVLSAVLVAPISPFLLFAIRNNEIWPMGKPPAGYNGRPYPPNISKYSEYMYNAGAYNANDAGEQNTYNAEPPKPENEYSYESQSASQSSYTTDTPDVGFSPPEPIVQPPAPEPEVTVPDQPEVTGEVAPPEAPKDFE